MQGVLNALSLALNKKVISALDENDVLEAKQQAVYSLICSYDEALPYIASNINLMWEQQRLSEILNGIPFFVIKGSCAAIYYPDPIRRTLGDIDLLVNPTYFKAAYDTLKEAGYSTSEIIDGEDIRHIRFKRNRIVIELHKRFATLNSAVQEKLLDQWLYSASPIIGGFGKYTFPMLPDELNGLVLLTHINQHLEEGIGLRHIIDWVMYVRHSISDQNWPSFKGKTDQLGLTILAKAIARFGQIYTGLNMEITWCKDIDDRIVGELYQYVFETGNFGYKDIFNNNIIKVMSHSRGIDGFFRNLQNRGLNNWKLLQRFPSLWPVAWVYQFIRYFKKGLRKDSIKRIGSNIKASKRRNKLLDELQATRYVFRNSPQKTADTCQDYIK